MLLIKNGLDATKILDQDEHLRHPSQVRNHGFIVDDTAQVHRRTQRTHTSENNINLKNNGKDMHMNETKLSNT